ncbi:S-adenosyl-L-methionine-dependent methyltransferase [Colletotrichum navitas]|uniref:S-adenosyl-L-methionine-dependent methyltransferase n=1 Tax=Colletotrichum navitas TaxID=681940 RepID=A0AAD8UXA5_9PEZI|nr:S-adenosyl-L-methionine-dependent methyltransferase [Colletotrichum navitas]KAK1564205.1 S-adenosyl-L-methionine-dependent methyltransferase [Colletotrichum navitas]
MSDGEYVFPNDEREQERLDIVNHMCMVTLDGASCLCPENKPTSADRVPDLGTGTGIWALDHADAHPEAAIVGVDFTPIKPGYVPPNCTFETDDAEKEWAWTEPFDFVSARNMNGSFANWEGVLGQAHNHLQPGRHLEIQGIIWPLVCDDGALEEDPALRKWSRLLVEACSKLGRPIDKTDTMPAKMAAAGIRFPISPWSKDKKLRNLGIRNREQLLQGLEAFSLGSFARVLDWSKEEVVVLCAGVRKDLQDLNIHAYWNRYVMYGRKPLKAEEESSLRN